MPVLGYQNLYDEYETLRIEVERLRLEILRAYCQKAFQSQSLCDDCFCPARAALGEQGKG
jgi:hypothetical protein